LCRGRGAEVSGETKRRYRGYLQRDAERLLFAGIRLPLLSERKEFERGKLARFSQVIIVPL
jgi:hypothetical protein